jgi:hypothetical protein
MEPLIVAQSERGKCSDRLNSPLLQQFCVRFEFSFSEFPPPVGASGGIAILPKRRQSRMASLAIVPIGAIPVKMPAILQTLQKTTAMGNSVRRCLLTDANRAREIRDRMRAAVLDAVGASRHRPPSASA